MGHRQLRAGAPLCTDGVTGDPALPLQQPGVSPLATTARWPREQLPPSTLEGNWQYLFFFLMKGFYLPDKAEWIHHTLLWPLRSAERDGAGISLPLSSALPARRRLACEQMPVRGPVPDNTWQQVIHTIPSFSPEPEQNCQLTLRIYSWRALVCHKAVPQHFHRRRHFSDIQPYVSTPTVFDCCTVLPLPQPSASARADLLKETC